ncbi:MAG: hypothetical protein LBP25_06560 [Tannerellaceae bacterium]|jgi:hypothetical protein|nr:hypothetical protein [Tannerellaceae bacterium]
MEKKADWLKRNNEALYLQGEATYNYINTEPQRSRMGFKSDTVQGDWFDDVFGPSLGVFQTKYDLWKDEATRTKVKTAALTEAKKAFIPVYRKLYTGFLKNNPLVTNEDLVAMDLPERGSGHKPVPVPVTHPVAYPDTSTPRRITMNYADSSGDHKKAKPYGVHGAEVRWQVFDAPKEVTLAELNESSFDTRTPIVFDFQEEQRGKQLYYAMRWENTRGEKGPFGLIEHIQIP